MLSSYNFLNQALFASKIEKLDKDQKYLVYCRSGNRSGIVCRMMDDLGLKSTFNLIGGMLFLDWTVSIVNLDSKVYSRVPPPKTLDEMNARLAIDSCEKIDFYIAKKYI